MPPDPQANRTNVPFSDRLGVRSQVVTDDLMRPENQQRVQPRSRGESLVRSAIGVCLVLACITLAVGVRMALDRRVAPCQSGHYFPPGATDSNCYAYPQGGTGAAIAVFSILLGTLIVFSGISAVATLRARSNSAATELPS